MDQLRNTVYEYQAETYGARRSMSQPASPLIVRLSSIPSPSLAIRNLGKNYMSNKLKPTAPDVQ